LVDITATNRWSPAIGSPIAEPVSVRRHSPRRFAHAFSQRIDFRHVTPPTSVDASELVFYDRSGRVMPAPHAGSIINRRA
jgi:hypothetical protein